MMKGDDYDYDDGDGFYEVLAGGDVWTGRPVKRNRRGTKYFFFFGGKSMGEVEGKLL